MLNKMAWCRVSGSTRRPIVLFYGRMITCKHQHNTVLMKQKKLINFLTALLLTTGVGAQTYVKAPSGSAMMAAEGTTIVTSGDVIIEVPMEISKNARMVANGNVSVRANIRGKGLLHMTGNAPTELRGGGYNIYNLMIDNPAGVILRENVRIAEDLTFSKGILKANNNYLILDPDATVSGAGPTSFLATEAGGELRKEVDNNYTDVGNLSIVAPVGVVNGSATAYLPISLNVSKINASQDGLNEAPYISIKANVGPPPNKPTIVTDYINNYWNIKFSNIGHNVTATYSAQYGGSGSLQPGSDINKLKPATWSSDNGYWSFATTPVNAASSTFSGDFDKSEVLVSAMNLCAKLNVKVFLEGAFNTSTGKMTNGLNSATKKLLAKTTPYADAPWRAPSVAVDPTFFNTHPNIIDWVLLELRDPNDRKVLISKQSYFVDIDGNLIDIDGNIGVHQKDISRFHVLIRHRNQFGVMTNLPQDASKGGVLSMDYASSHGTAFDDPDPTINASPLQGVTSGGKAVYCLHRGDVNSSNTLNAIDISLIRNYIKAGRTADLYDIRDINLSGTLNAIDIAQIRAKLKANITVSNLKNVPIQ